MRSLRTQLREGVWGLVRARHEARRIEGSPQFVRALVGCLFREDVELRKRAADVARRVTERDAAPLWPHAEEFAGVLAAMDPAESRTRWHLGLVMARVAHTHEQRLRAARMLELLAGDASNVVRCSAIEGMALLAIEESGLRERAAEMVEMALRSGSKAEKSRANAMQRRLLRATG